MECVQPDYCVVAYTQSQKHRCFDTFTLTFTYLDNLNGIIFILSEVSLVVSSLHATVKIFKFHRMDVSSSYQGIFASTLLCFPI